METKMKTRKQIVDKMEEIYKKGKEDSTVCIPKIILAGGCVGLGFRRRRLFRYR